MEKFFGHHKRLLKKTAQQLGGKTSAPAKTPAAKATEQERKRHHTERVARHKKIWELFRAGYSKEDIARIVGVSSHSVYRALEQERPPLSPSLAQHSSWSRSLRTLLEQEVERGVPYSSSAL